MFVHRRYRKKYGKIKEPLSPTSPTSKDDIPLKEKNLEKAMPIMNLKSCKSVHMHIMIFTCVCILFDSPSGQLKGSRSEDFSRTTNHTVH